VPKSRLYTQQKKLGLTMKNDELEAKVNQTSTEIMELRFRMQKTEVIKSIIQKR